MADSNDVTGNRDDLVVDASRCLRMRFSASSCRRCIDICPHGAVVIDGRLSIDTEKCLGCTLCTAVCPTGALEQSSDFSACLAHLARVPEPVLGCIRTKERSNAAMACLGGLSEENLLALYHTLAGRLTLNLSLCHDCPNSPMVAGLKQRLDAISEARLSYGNCCVVMAESAQDIHYCDETVGRRSFFRSFSTSLFTSAAVILASNNEQTERHTGYAVKRLPYRRLLLNSTVDKLPELLKIQAGKHFDSSVSFVETCTRCQGCVAICPTGALKTEDIDGPPAFEQLLCTGCGLCREFCLDEALRISSGNCDDLTA